MASTARRVRAAVARRGPVLCLGIVLACLVLAGAGRDRAQASEALPAMLGIDWRTIFSGFVDAQGQAFGFTAPGENGYPRECHARAGSCRQSACCDGNCNAWADGIPSTDRPWLATVRQRLDCRSEWVKAEPGQAMFPTGWPESKVKAVILSAYKAGRALPARGDLWCGCAGDTTVFGRQTGGVITEAWPSADQACGCEAVPLHKR